MATKLTLKGTQQLTINPVIHTFIGFLPLNRIEFVDKIRNEVESNPMLEIETPSTEFQKDNKEHNALEKRMERADSSYVNRYEDEGFLKKNDDKLDKNSAIELFTASKTTLTDHLIKQAMSQFNKKEFPIAEHIIYNLSADGYLNLEIESIASSLSTTPEKIEEIRKQIHQFDPPGVGARNLKECLLAQIPLNEENEKLRILVENHLENISKSKYDNIIKNLKISHEELGVLLKNLRRLNPKPGANFEKEEIDYAQVDLLLIKENNEYKIKFVDEGIPKMLLSQYYERMLEHKAMDKKTKSYLKSNYRNAQLFIEGIDLRKSMLVKIAELLVKKQKDFLDYGEKWKKPLTMKEIANELNYNESTISRAVSNKFIASDKGLISLKSFFSYGIKGEFGFKHSVETIKDKIKRIIEEEPKEKPYSDQDVVAKLSNLGIKISRRTIRNYRDELNIPSSSKRKSQYKLNPK